MDRFLFIALMLCLAEGCSKIDPEQNTDYGFHDDYEDEVFAYLKKKGGNHGQLSSYRGQLRYPSIVYSPNEQSNFTWWKSRIT